MPGIIVNCTIVASKLVSNKFTVVIGWSHVRTKKQYTALVYCIHAQ